MADYFVIGESGEVLEGPVDLGTLRIWSQEGRILPETRLKNVESGLVVLASKLRGMDFKGRELRRATDFQNPVFKSPYPRDLGPKHEDFQREVSIAWFCNILGFVLLCCYGIGAIFFGIAIYRANLAKQSGPDIGSGARIVAIVGLCLSILVLAIRTLPLSVITYLG